MHSGRWHIDTRPVTAPNITQDTSITTNDGNAFLHGSCDVREQRPTALRRIWRGATHNLLGFVDQSIAEIRPFNVGTTKITPVST